MQIKKRNGDIVPYNGQKIKDALKKAFLEVDGSVPQYAEQKIDNIESYIKEQCEESENYGEVLGVEDIQGLCENGLMSTKRKDVARAYIRYRYKREVAREHKDDFFKAISEKLTASNVQNQNANVDEHSFGGRMGEANSVMLKQYALDYCVSDMARKNHLENMIYIHDLDSYAVGMHNCLTIPFDKLLKEGFNTRQTDVRPANSVNTAFQLIAVIFQLQSLQ